MILVVPNLRRRWKDSGDMSSFLVVLTAKLPPPLKPFEALFVILVNIAVGGRGYLLDAPTLLCERRFWS